MKKAEMGRFNISPDEDSSSYSSNSDFNYSYPTKQAALKSHYADVDPENQNFLLESNVGKKKYETDFIRSSITHLLCATKDFSWWLSCLGCDLPPGGRRHL